MEINNKKDKLEIINNIDKYNQLVYDDNSNNYYILKKYKDEHEKKHESEILNKIGRVSWAPTYIKNIDNDFVLLSVPSQDSITTNLYDFIFKSNNLIDWGEQDDNMNFDLEISLIDQLLTGLNELHKKNITHCCIDLNNILIGDRQIFFSNYEKSLSNVPLTCSKMGVVAPEIVERFISGEKNILDPINFYKSVDIFCLGLVILTILNKKFPFSELLKKNDNFEKYIGALFKLYSDKNWQMQFLQSTWDDYEDMNEIRKKISGSRNVLKKYIIKMLDVNPKKRIDLQTVIDNVKIVYDSVKNFAKYFLSKRKNEHKKVKYNKLQKLDEEYNNYIKLILKLENEIMNISDLNVDLEEKQIERGIKNPSKLRIIQSDDTNDDKQTIINDFRKILLLKRRLVSNYTDEYNVKKSNVDKFKSIKTRDIKTLLWIDEYQKIMNSIKIKLEDIEKKYTNLKNKMQIFLLNQSKSNDNLLKNEFVDIPLTPPLVGGGKLRKIKKELIGGGNMVKRVGEYFFENKTIGVGSYGQVYMGWGKNNKLYIIKKLANTSVSINEILNLRDIRKKNNDKCFNNILCYHDHVIDNNYIYLITEYIEDVVDMFDFIQTNLASLNISQLVIIMINLTRAVKVIHDLGIAHADLKPENILINPDTLDLQLIDFGGSCNENRFEMCSITGTIEFGSPEYLDALLSKKVNLGNMDRYISGDIFSLGIIFYCLVNNNLLPIDAIYYINDQTQLLKQLIKIYSDGIISKSGNEEIDELIKEMTQYDYLKRPNLRYIIQTLEELLHNLQFV